MPLYLKRIFLAGNVTRDTEIKITSAGKRIGNFSVAVSSGKGENQKSEFFDAVCFDKTAEFAEKYVKKGANLLIEGNLQQENWTDTKTGQKREKVKVIANVITMVSSPDRNNYQTNQTNQPAEKNNYYNNNINNAGHKYSREDARMEEPLQDDIPF